MLCMKKAIIIFLLLISYQMVFAQSQRPKCYYDDISTESVLNYLTEEEEKSFFICLRTAGIDTSNILWFQESLRDSISKNRRYCNVLNVSKNTNQNVLTKKINKGENRLPEPQCLVFIMRQDYNTHILFQVYY
jgi:hypothetical protein